MPKLARAGPVGRDNVPRVVIVSASLVSNNGECKQGAGGIFIKINGVGASVHKHGNGSSHRQYGGNAIPRLGSAKPARLPHRLTRFDVLSNNRPD